MLPVLTLLLISPSLINKLHKGYQMHEDVNHITQLLKELHGIDVSMYESSFLKKSIRQHMEKAACQSIDGYEQMMAANKNEAMLFADSLNVSYSVFFRDSLAFALLKRIIIPTMLFRKQHKKTFRIWSAACANGQESYSLAIMMEELGNDHKKTDYRIFGTDKDNERVKNAQSGFYNTEAVSNVTQEQIKKWFTRKENGYSVIPGLKKNITFSVFDLLDAKYSSPPESIYGGFDIVMCANLLFYYKTDYRKLIIQKIKNSLNKDGVVITGECERDILLNNGFQEAYPNASIFKHP